MKKLIFFVALCGVLFLGLGLSHGQTYQMTGGYTTGDTVTNTGVKACSLKVAHSYRQISVAALVTKISGTVAGTITLQGSLDGTNFVTVDTAIFVHGNSAYPKLATYTSTNTATQTQIWIMNGTPYLWYKLSYTGSGTMVATLKGYLLPRENQ